MKNNMKKGMKNSIEKEIKFDDIFKEMIEEFKNELKETDWLEVKEEVFPFLKKYAMAKFMIISGNEETKVIAQDSIEAIKRGMDDLKDAFVAKLSNRLIEIIVKILKSLIIKELLPLLLV